MGSHGHAYPVFPVARAPLRQTHRAPAGDQLVWTFQPLFRRLWQLKQDRGPQDEDLSVPKLVVMRHFRLYEQSPTMASSETLP
jgi:hypothetical protein